MATIVIGGQSRSIGKTSVLCALIAAMPGRRFTAIKITQCHLTTRPGALCCGKTGSEPASVDLSS
jgi:hypothetical protein